MNYGQVFYVDTANGEGLRTSLFVSGCTHHCEGCFNKDTWDFNYGKPFDKNIQDKIIESINPTYIDGLTILGGEPMEVINQKELKPFIERVKKESPHSTIWIYSGYTIEELMDENNKRCHSKDTMDILSMIDVLVDGEFVLAKKNINHRFKGSSNQRVIDVKETLKEGKVILSIFND